MPGVSEGRSHISVDELITVVAGAVAGNVTVTGIDTNDVLKSVLFYDPSGGGAGLGTFADLTSEFKITAKDTINNAAGTDTSGGQLFLKFDLANPFGGPELGRT